jgi:hypothetical protein
MLWDMWKRGFDTWEQHTARVLAEWLKSPAVLEPSGAVLSATFKAKAARDEALGRWWALWGLPTRADQERTLHRLNQLQSRLIDLEDQLEELEGRER